ncbi:sugar ABC transporter substrate-binding protein [Clostridium chromiireducens]|uniref:sugar ABC transporter substrate-binding protein n=1 Tax=Clostridium chromiireducens TaxID=225345 RepID=UPI003AF5953B
MKIKKIASFMLVTVISAVALTGCVNNSKKTIAFLPKQLDGVEYWEAMRTGIENEASNSGYKLVAMASKNGDINEQKELMNQMIKDKVDAIILAPSSVTELVPEIKEANEADIPVVLVDTNVDSGLLEANKAKIAPYVGVDNYAGGELIGKEVASKLQKGSQVAILGGGVGQTNSDERCKGFRDAVTKAGMNVVTQLSTNWSANDGYIQAESILKAYPDVKAMFTVNNTVYKGAYEASKDLGKQLVMGTFDYDDNTMNRINAGELGCTLSQDSDSMTKMTIDTINKILSGESVEPNIVSDAKLITKK